MNQNVIVIGTGTANLASVLALLLRLGLHPSISQSAAEIEDASLVVLPGVGAFGAARETLARKHLDEVVIQRVKKRRPLLAICLGLQLLAEASEESPGVPGLGCIPGIVRRFPQSVRAPQLGWNRIEALPGGELLESGFAYFANSYRITEPARGWNAATADHGGSFVAALEQDGVVACQFHPELSGDFGKRLVKRWIARAIPC